MNHYNVILLILLVIVEAIAMSTIEYGTNNKSKVYIIGILLYLLVGYILYLILVQNDLAITNAKWNVLSIILVTSVTTNSDASTDGAAVPMRTEVEALSILLEPSEPDIPAGSSPVSTVSSKRAAPFVP